MKGLHRPLLVMLALAGGMTLNAADPLTIGIVPFDVSWAEGSGTTDAGKALSTLVRVEPREAAQTITTEVARTTAKRQ